MIQKIDCMFLIGLPGSGKSTFRDKFLQEHSDYVVISTDDMIDNFAADNFISYSEAWHVVDLKQIESKAKIACINAVADYKPILIDRTNMTQKSRMIFSALLTDDYRKVAVVFIVEENVLNERLRTRSVTGKSIPSPVIEHMRQQYVPPTLFEFDEIVYI